MSTIALSQDRTPSLEESTKETKSAVQSGVATIGTGLRTVSLTAIDTAGRFADGIDWVLNIPRQIGGLAAYIPMPAAKEVGNALGAIFSGAFSALFHGGTVGTFKWLNFIRRQNAVDGVLSETLLPDREISSATAKSFISRVEDAEVKSDLTQYVTLVTKLAGVTGSSKLSESERTQESAVLNQDLARLELRLARRAELNELKRLLHAPKEASLASEAELHYLATRMADTMISRIEGYYKNNAGSLAATVTGEWSDLASQGSAGRDALITKIERKLLDTYLAERNGQEVEGKLTEIRNDVSEAFKTQSAFREGVLFSVFGVLMYTGLLSTVISGTISGVALVTGKVGEFLSAFTPAWITEGLANAVGYAEVAVASVLGYMGLKSAATLKSVFGGSGESANTKAADVYHANTEAKGLDVAKGTDVATHTTTHADANIRADGGGAVEALKAQLDSVSARTDVVASGLHEGTSSHVQTDAAVRIEVPAASIHATPHMELRANVQEGLRIDPSIKVESIKVTPR